ncbi:MAG: hypothetical protein JO222_09105 [Frankiales bacterium]|nr:hypothetical protein [Frankiales bacterium]
MIARLRAFFRTRTGRLVLHDGTVALGVGYAAWEAAGHSLTWAATSAAGLVAAKAFLRLILPVPPAVTPSIRPDLARNVVTTLDEGNQKAVDQFLGSLSQLTIQTAGVRGRLPATSGRKLGHLPSPRDDRDYAYKPSAAARRLPTVHNASGLTFDALGNLQVGDCAEAGEEHARQVIAHLAGRTYTPTLDGTIALYSAITGYRPGVPSTDNGTVLRQMLAYLKRNGVITEYQAVPTDTTSLRAAVVDHGAVICGFALPAGAEAEGVNWRVPRSGRAAGSWGGHCVPLVGATSQLFDFISWGELGTVSHGFVNDYIDEAWVVTYADTSL